MIGAAAMVARVSEINEAKKAEDSEGSTRVRDGAGAGEGGKREATSCPKGTVAAPEFPALFGAHSIKRSAPGQAGRARKDNVRRCADTADNADCLELPLEPCPLKLGRTGPRLEHAKLLLKVVRSMPLRHKLADIERRVGEWCEVMRNYERGGGKAQSRQGAAPLYAVGSA